MAFPSAPTTAQIVSSVGANSQEQRWSRDVVAGHLGRSIFSRVRGGFLGGKPIMSTGQTRNLQGQTVNIKAEAPLGGPGRQGSGLQRSGYGENIRFKMFTLTFGNHWNGVSQNNITASQTMLGTGEFDQKSAGMLKEWFGQLHDFMVEAETIRCITSSAANTSRLRLYAGSATSIATLTGADTANEDFFRKMAVRMQENMAVPFSIAKKGGQEINRYLILPPEQALDDMRASGEWKDLLAQACLRGEDNCLFTGQFPDWCGSTIVPWVVQNNPGSGTQGAFCSPIAFLGETIPAGPAAFALKGGGGNATADELTKNLFFQHFTGAPAQYFEQTKIPQETTEVKFALIRDITTGKFAFISYQVTDGITITGLKKLGAAANGTVATTVGSIAWGSPGVWANKLLDCDSQAITVGSPIWPCNAKGQCYKSSWGLAQHAFIEGWGSIADTFMGRRTKNNDDDHQRLVEIGFEEQYGLNGVIDANGLYPNILQGISAWNPDGAPTNIT